jgi:transposase
MLAMPDRFDHTLEHTLKTKLSKPGDAPDDAVAPVRRIELITGPGRRRRWSDDDKARIIAESLRPGSCVSEVARRNGMSPQQLFGWRRQARGRMAAQPVEADARSRSSRSPADEASEREPTFAPVIVAACPPVPPTALLPGHIEIAIGDCIVRVLGQVEVGPLTAVLRSIRRAS